MLETPAQDIARSAVARNGGRGVTGTAAGEADFKVDTGHFFHAGHDLSIGVTNT